MYKDAHLYCAPKNAGPNDRQGIYKKLLDSYKQFINSLSGSNWKLLITY